MTPDETIQKGNEAARLLTDPLFIEAFDTVKTEINASWEETPARDTEGRERLWLMLKLLGRVRAHIETIAANGEIEKKRIAELDAERKFLGIKF